MHEVGELWLKAEQGTLSIKQEEAFRSLIAHEGVELEFMRDGVPYRSDHPDAFDDRGMSSPVHEYYGAHDMAPGDKNGDFQHYSGMDREPLDFALEGDLSNLDDLLAVIRKEFMDEE
ncbi:hypothetical protein DEF23_09295 [Marinitenerispora sediminis]|uniref:Uncharacterized protein n=2 Tax=Marinitenerispora sediminis TaxID=1931232 RepID=A0A368T874_9ACTN|nr:hypothetical protein DEF28_01920 [Marinitenerispora sediminis]RCV58271.1 hypothetical protein DEF23_09295 [Marinitenerispora sediminis]RCV58493.1 hypothetical protein DEF24_13330 [Marinitenerispora sediminis]